MKTPAMFRRALAVATILGGVLATSVGTAVAADAPATPATPATAWTCSSKAFCVAIGYFVEGGKHQPLATSWNGHACSQLSFPSVAGADEGQLNGIDCFSAKDCVAVGWTNNGDADSDLITRFNGAAWKTATIKNGAPCS